MSNSYVNCSLPRTLLDDYGVEMAVEAGKKASEGGPDEAVGVRKADTASCEGVSILSRNAFSSRPVYVFLNALRIPRHGLHKQSCDKSSLFASEGNTATL